MAEATLVADWAAEAKQSSGLAGSEAVKDSAEEVEDSVVGLAAEAD